MIFSLRISILDITTHQKCVYNTYKQDLETTEIYEFKSSQIFNLVSESLESGFSRMSGIRLSKRPDIQWPDTDLFAILQDV